MACSCLPRCRRPAVAPCCPSLVPDAALAEDDDPVWPSARIGVAEALWGEGFLFPGGGAEVLRLAKPLGLSAASSLLLIGAGSGGPPRCIAERIRRLGHRLRSQSPPRRACQRAEPARRAGASRAGGALGSAAPKFPRALLPPRHGDRAAARRRARAAAGRRGAGAEARRAARAAGGGGRPAARSGRSDGRHLGAARPSSRDAAERTGDHRHSGASRVRRADRRGRVAPATCRTRSHGWRDGGAGDGRRSARRCGRSPWWCARPNCGWRASA